MLISGIISETAIEFDRKCNRGLELRLTSWHSGHALYRLKRYHEAIADFTAALKASPNNAHLRTSRGSAEASLDRLDAAIADCEEALRQEPDPADREPLALLCNN